jgi:hypothetical protein
MKETSLSDCNPAQPAQAQLYQQAQESAREASVSRLFCGGPRAHFQTLQRSQTN